MIRELLWLMVDVALGVILAGMLAPVAITRLPEQYRGAPALWALALVSVVIVAVCRRALGIGAVDRPH